VFISRSEGLQSRRVGVSLGALKMREWKMQEWKMREQTAGVENAGVDCRGGKCRSNNVWKAVEKNFMMTASQSGEKELQRLFAGQ